ncbi:MAG: signal peptidase II [Paludibacteraceae bacterium]|nr:signal peptidase II [Paludibacteraceae bacterium]
MKRTTQQSILVVAIIVMAVVLDQWTKIYIRTHFQLGEAHAVTSWFYICFVENNGMAFGIEWFSKLLLTLFRIAAVGALGYYLHLLIRRTNSSLVAEQQLLHPWGYLTMVSLVTAGAIGNIIDCVAYGKIFGYGDWFYGKVVDMLYFPLIHNAAGECIFFRPVFNIADSCITVAVIAILLFFRQDLDVSLKKTKD